MTSQLTQYSAAVGFLLPLVIAFIQKEDWPNWLKSVVGTGGCVAAAVVTAAVEHKLNTKDISASVITVFTLTKLSYLSVYKPAGWAQPKIKSST